MMGLFFMAVAKDGEFNESACAAERGGGLLAAAVAGQTYNVSGLGRGGGGGERGGVMGGSVGEEDGA